MEKISRILPPSARTSSYDVSRAQPARPGAPSLGRPQIRSVADRLTLSDHLTQSMADSMPMEEMPMHNSKLAAGQYRSQDNVRAKMVREMTDRFFMRDPSAKDLVKDTDQTHSEEVVTRSLEATESKVMPESSKELTL